MINGIGLKEEIQQYISLVNSVPQDLQPYKRVQLKLMIALNIVQQVIMLIWNFETRAIYFQIVIVRDVLTVDTTRGQAKLVINTSLV